MNKKLSLKILCLALSFFLLAPFASEIRADEINIGPDIISEAAVVLDYDTGEIIYEKNANNKMFLASTTKLMTALLFAENKSKSDSIEYTEAAKAQPPYTVDSEQMKPYGKSMQVGDILSGDVVMKELLLFSGNDIAYMIADSVGGDASNFATMMNDKAEKLGLINTHFENPNGLPVNGFDVNYSTAYELSLITKAAYENDWIKETMGLSTADIILPRDTRIKIENRNTELNKNGNIGGKTGVTNDAGTCFAGIYERDGRKVIGVVLKCDRNDNNKRFEDLNSMMNYSYSASRQPFKKSGTEISSVELNYKLFRFFGPTETITAPITLAEDANLYKNNINDSEGKITFDNTSTNAWEIANDNTINLTLSVKNFSSTVKGTIDISSSDLLKANIGIYLAILGIIIIIIILLLLLRNLVRNINRPNKRNTRRSRK